MKTIFLLLILFALPATATEPGQDAYVLQLDEDFPLEKVKGKGIKKQPVVKVGLAEGALPPTVQHRLFQESGLASLVSGMDALDKDRLTLRAENQEPTKVAARYKGKIPADSIQKLKELISQYRREKK